MCSGVPQIGETDQSFQISVALQFYLGIGPFETDFEAAQSYFT